MFKRCFLPIREASKESSKRSPGDKPIKTTKLLVAVCKICLYQIMSVRFGRTGNNVGRHT